MDRLKPCQARDPLRPQTGDESVQDGHTQKYLTQYTLVRRTSDGEKTSTPLTVVVRSEDVERRVQLPLVAQGDPTAIRNIPPKDRVYLPRPWVRGDVDDPAFEAMFKQSGFSIQHAILVVPILTEYEQDEYVRNPKAFRLLMSADDWMNDARRCFWIVDGANRRRLSILFGSHVNMQVLDPCVGSDVCRCVAIHSNEGSGHVHNKTNMMDKIALVRKLRADGNNVDTIAKMMSAWGVLSTIQQISQATHVWNVLPLTPLFDEQHAQPYASHPPQTH